MRAEAEALRDYGKAHGRLAKITADVDRVQSRADGHVLISTGITAEDEAMNRAERVADAYGGYARSTAKPADAERPAVVTVYNVFGDQLLTRRVGGR
ncbi:hypothetical protein GCM10010521_03430 [Streptomyces rameus]|uniref:Uncharacterized protein n=1 Tax=Streptomyces rameus TaxID=68261 RepID=A0ABP6MM78_9ACTN